jgi:hypothetical protein
MVLEPERKLQIDVMDDQICYPPCQSAKNNSGADGNIKQIMAFLPNPKNELSHSQ